jgi:phosphoribosylanthranilate isomerase
VSFVPEAFERGFIKVCGVTNVDDALMVAKLGASAMGVILAESPRRVSLEDARTITDEVAGTILRCAVFRNNGDAHVLRHLDGLDVEVVQIHGVLAPSLLKELRDRPLLIVKALNIEADEFLSFDETSVDAVLIDGPKPGSGVAHSWDRLRERHFEVPVIAAGGITPDNVAAIITETLTWGVDCASGVESSPGEKDRAMVEHYVTNARQAFDVMGA